MTTPSKTTQATPENPKIILVSLDAPAIDKELMDMVQKQIEERIPELNRTVSYTAKQMCGKEFWRLLPKVNRIHAGEYVSYLVTLKKLPLVPDGKTLSNANKYRLK